MSPASNPPAETIAIAAPGADFATSNATGTALAASEARFQALFASSPAGIALVRPDGGILQVNPAWCAILGYPEAELLDANVQDLTHPDDLELSLTMAQRALRGELTTYEIDVRFLRQDGTPVPSRLSATLLGEASGSAPCFVFQLLDVTAQQTAEAKLAAARQYASELVQRVSDGVCEIDRHWRLTGVNAAAERLFGRSRQELLGTDFWRMFPSAVGTPDYAACQRAMETGPAASVDIYYAPTGARLSVRMVPSPGGLTAIVRDHSAMTRLGYDPRLSETRFRTLVDHLPVVVYLLDADETASALYFNPAVEAMFGLPPQRIQAGGEHWLDYIHPDDYERIKTLDEAAARRASASWRSTGCGTPTAPTSGGGTNASRCTMTGIGSSARSA